MRLTSFKNKYHSSKPSHLSDAFAAMSEFSTRRRKKEIRKVSGIPLVVVLLFLTTIINSESFGSGMIIISDEERVSTTTNNNSVVTWNEMTTSIGLQKKVSPPYLARDYALVHVAMYDALLKIMKIKEYNSTPAAQTAIAAGAASEVLTYLFPDNATQIAALEAAQLAAGMRGYDNDNNSNNNAGQITSASTIGHNIGKKVVNYARTDGSSEVWNGTMPPPSPGVWTGTDPVDPLFGNMKTYILTSGAEFQPPPPYPYGSEQDLADVQAVKDAAHARTAEQVAIVHKWADLPPPTIWNNILNDRIKKHNLGIYDSARASAYLNTAMYDGFVSCWYTKFTYWTARPFQRITDDDPTFTTVVPTPNFPSYTSGHSTISSAAAIIMGQLFPEEASYFLEQAEEAKMSRLWAGIHFPQDNENGFKVGKQIGSKYISNMMEPAQPFVITK
jgi:hypothetical protein